MEENYIYNSEYIGVTKLGTFFVGKDIPPIVVINLSTRTDRREKTIEAMKNAKLPFMFFTATPHNNPVRGCLESHVSVIKWAYEKTHPQVCIFEDDFVIQFPLENVPVFPEDWNMIYLGGLCTSVKHWNPVLSGVTENIDTNVFIKGTFYCNHAYIVRDAMYKKIVDEGWVYNKEVDQYYTSEIHDKLGYNVYMSYLQYVIQYEGWSDIDNKNKWCNFTWPNPGQTFGIP